MKFTKTRPAVLVVAALVVLSMVAMPAMAAVTVDTETTNTSTTSDWQDGTTVTDLDNSSQTSTIEVSSDNASSGDDFALEMAVNDSDSEQDGETIYTTDAQWTATNSTQGHYQLNVTHATVFEDLERDAGETVTVDVTVTVNESETSEESVTFQIDAQNDADSAVAVVYGDEAEFADTTSRFDISSYNPFSDDEDAVGAAQAEQTVGVNGTETDTIRVESANGSVTDSLDASISGLSDGDFMTLTTTTFDDDRIPVFYESASDASWVDTDEDTYATVDAEGDTLTIHNVNESVDSDSDVDVMATTNDAIGFGATYSMARDYGAGLTDAVSLGTRALDYNFDPTYEEA